MPLPCHHLTKARKTFAKTKQADDSDKGSKLKWKKRV